MFLRRTLNEIQSSSLDYHCHCGCGNTSERGEFGAFKTNVNAELFRSIGNERLIYVKMICLLKSATTRINGFGEEFELLFFSAFETGRER